MPDLISNIAARVGITPEQAQTGFGVILEGLKRFAPELYTKVAGYLPEAGPAEFSAQTAMAGGSEGLMGNLAGMAGKLFGGHTGEAAQFLEMFSKAGFSMEQVKEFAPAALHHLKDVVPPEIVEEICEKIPGL
jgi:hypothetical protein